MTTLLPCVETGATSDARASVVWLHGLGADGHDFEPIVPLLGVGELGVRFVFPHAPAIPVSINAGFVMPAWYDIRELDLRREPDLVGVRRSCAQVVALVERERERGVPAERIVLAGFSQGGAIALAAGLRFPERLAGLMALSTYLVDEDGLRRERSAANADVPVFAAHGTSDPMVPYERGEAGRDRLISLGYTVEWHAYPMQHQVCQEEIDDIGAWLRARLGG
ncbi:MAG: alpha/beta hydrolase [Planctomycetes bacterium]|nr:alpha/beta hydrolase [Planctomycetota bacterium]